MHPSMYETTVQALQRLEDIFQDAAKENKFANIKLTSPDQLLRQKPITSLAPQEPHHFFNSAAQPPRVEAVRVPRVTAGRNPRVEDVPFEEDEPQRLIVAYPTDAVVVSPITPRISPPLITQDVAPPAAAPPLTPTPNRS